MSPERAEATQLMLEIDLPLSAKPPLRRSSDAGRSLDRMVALALRRGYAVSYLNLLDQIAHFRQTNPYNGFLAVLQRPHPVHLLTDDQWANKWGRDVKPSEHPIVLLDPFGPLKFVFDVSQTEPSSYPRNLPASSRTPTQ